MGGVMSQPNNGEHQDTPEQKRAFVEWFHKQKDDYFWCLNQPDVLERYAGQVVVLHNRVVLGSGPGHLQAKEDARRQVETRGETLPPAADLLFVVIPEQVWFDAASLP